MISWGTVKIFPKNIHIKRRWSQFMISNGFMYFQFHFNRSDFTCGDETKSKIISNKKHIAAAHLKFWFNVPPSFHDLCFGTEKRVIYAIYLFILEKQLKAEMRTYKTHWTDKMLFRHSRCFYILLWFKHKNIYYFAMIDFALMSVLEMSCSLMSVVRFLWLFFLELAATHTFSLIFKKTRETLWNIMHAKNDTALCFLIQNSCFRHTLDYLMH